MKRIVGLLATGRKKIDHAAPVLDFYTSPLFQKTVHYAQKNYTQIYFFNAKDGLLLPNQTLEPYDLSIKLFSIKERKDWAQKVISDLSEYESPDSTIISLHGGKVYRDHLEPQLQKRGYDYEVPLEGLGIGQQLAWLDYQIKQSGS